MSTTRLLLVLTATCCFGSASAQTAPVSPRAAQAPATMASPNTTRSSMSNAAAGVGTVVTDSTSNSGNSRTSTKTKGMMRGSKGKVKTKM